MVEITPLLLVGVGKIMVMDVVSASHLGIIKEHLEENPQVEFKMRRFQGTWTMGMIDMFDEGTYAVVSDPSFSRCVKLMSNILLHGVGNNECSSND